MFLLNIGIEVDRMFSVGDLIDRGNDSASCIGLLDQDWFHAVLGNHDQMMLGHDKYLWMINGGCWSEDFELDDIDHLIKLIVDNMSQLIEVETANGTIGVVHADSEDDWRDNGVHTLHHNIWSRSKVRSQDDREISGIDMVVCGHTVVDHMSVLGNVLYIDTGAVFTDKMTIVSAEQVYQTILMG